MHKPVLGTCGCAFAQHHEATGRKIRWTRNIAVVTAAAAVAMSAVLGTPSPAKADTDTATDTASTATDARKKHHRDIEVIAHRGGNDIGAEHTMDTLREALRLGADAVEVDVRFTKDDVPVLMHDATLNRTTDCRGRVKHKTLRQLKRCDAGDGQHVPTLRQGLKLIAKHDAHVYVHVKQTGDGKHYKKIVRALNHYHLNNGRKATTIADSAHLLRKLKKAGSKRLGLVFNDRKGWNARYPVLVAYNTPIKRDLVKRAHRRGQIVLAVQDHQMSLGDLVRHDTKVDGFMANHLMDTLERLGRHDFDDEDGRWGRAKSIEGPSDDFPTTGLDGA